MKLEGRISANDGRENGLWTTFDQNRQISHFDRIKGLIPVAAERIVNEILNRGQHPGYKIGVVSLDRACFHVLQEKSGLSVNQKDLLYSIEQRVREDDFGERLPGAKRFQ